MAPRHRHRAGSQRVSGAWSVAPCGAAAISRTARPATQPPTPHQPERGSRLCISGAATSSAKGSSRMNSGWTSASGPLTRARLWNSAAQTTPHMPTTQKGRRTSSASSRNPPRLLADAALRWKAVPTALLAAPATANTAASSITTVSCLREASARSFGPFSLRTAVAGRLITAPVSRAGDG